MSRLRDALLKKANDCATGVNGHGPDRLTAEAYFDAAAMVDAEEKERRDHKPSMAMGWEGVRQMAVDHARAIVPNMEPGEIYVHGIPDLSTFRIVVTLEEKFNELPSNKT